MQRLGVALAAFVVLASTVFADSAIDELRATLYRHALAGEEAAAVPVARDLVEATKTAFGPEALETACSLDLLADRLLNIASAEQPLDIKQFEEPESLYRHALAIRKKRLAPNHPDIALSFLQVVKAIDEKVRSDEALAAGKESLRILEAAGDDHRADVALALICLRGTHHAVGNTAEADKCSARIGELRDSLCESAETMAVPIARPPSDTTERSSPFAGSGLWREHGTRGKACYLQQDLNGAFFHFVRAARLRPDVGETHNNVGTVLSALGLTDKACLEFAEAVRLQPDSPTMRVNLANAYAAAGRFADAEHQYRALLKSEPKNASLRNNLGVVLFKNGRRDAAIKEFGEALSIDPSLKDARESLEIALRDEAGQPTTNGVHARKWTSADGTKSQEATFLESRDGIVYVQRMDGTHAQLPLSRLSDKDRQYVAELSAKAPKDSLFEDVPKSPSALTPATPDNPHPASEANSRMLVATKEAWESLMNADERLAKQEFGLPSERFRATAFLYSKIPLENADPILVRHVLRCVSIQKKAAQACLAFESEMQALGAGVEQAANLGAALGSAASNPDEAQTAAAGLALLFGGIANAGVADEAKRLQDKFQQTVAPIAKELEACGVADETVASELSKKYGVPFVDAF